MGKTYEQLERFRCKCLFLGLAPKFRSFGQSSLTTIASKDAAIESHASSIQTHVIGNHCDTFHPKGVRAWIKKRGGLTQKVIISSR
jgi:hypothetical protein